MRPTGVTVLAILDFLVGILAILGGGLIIGVSGSGILSAYGYAMFSGLVGIIGAFAIVIGLFAILVGWGMWTGKGWAWTLAVVLYGLGALFSLISVVGGGIGSFVTLLIDVLLLWYMFRPHVKAYFGKATGMMQQPPAMQTPPTTST